MKNPETPDQNVAAAATGSSPRAQDGIRRLVDHVQARLADAQGDLDPRAPEDLTDALNAVEAAPTEATGAPTPEWPALLERGRRGGENGARAIAVAYSRGIRVGLERAGETLVIGPDDRDAELADALDAATSLPRSELLPEVRRLTGQRARWQDLIDWHGKPAPTAVAVVFKLVPYATRAHTACRLYAGPDRDHLALCGDLRLRHHEYAALQDALTPPTPPQADTTAASIAACAKHSAEVEAMAQAYDEAREGLMHHRQQLAAENAQWQAQIANVRRAILARDHWDLIPVKAIDDALRVGTGLVEPTNTEELPESALQRFADQLWRLASGLAERGIPLRDGEIQGAGVDTALAELDSLRRYIEARDRGLSAYEAREDGWPSAGLGSVPQDRTGDGVPEVEQAEQQGWSGQQMTGLAALQHLAAEQDADPTPSGLCEAGPDHVTCIVADPIHRRIYHGGQA